MPARRSREKIAPKRSLRNRVLWIPSPAQSFARFVLALSLENPSHRAALSKRTRVGYLFHIRRNLASGVKGSFAGRTDFFAEFRCEASGEAVRSGAFR
jgi:hypothetical protein